MAAVHNLYVQAGGELALAILKYVQARLALFAEMGVRVRVHKVRRADLRDPRLVAAMKRRGVEALPALVTPNGAYCGVGRIRDVYALNVRKFRAWKRQQAGASGGGAAPEDALAAFYESEMTFERAAADDGLETSGDEIGEGGGMMDAFRHTMQRREAPAALPRTALGRRRDNVDASADDDDAMFDQAFAAGDGLDADGEGSLDAGGGAQDDLMERAYWANQELTL